MYWPVECLPKSSANSKQATKENRYRLANCIRDVHRFLRDHEHQATRGGFRADVVNVWD
jgi:hypothetical protein